MCILIDESNSYKEIYSIISLYSDMEQTQK